MSPEDLIINSLPLNLLQMLTGKLLGDGTITKQSNRIPRFRFAHSVNDKEWCFQCYTDLSRYISLSYPKFRRVYDNRLKKGYSDTCYVQAHKQLWMEDLFQTWYKKGKKVIPEKVLRHTISPLCLSWWYQDDGHLKVKDGVIKKIILSTESFSNEEIIFLKSLILSYFHINFSIDNQKRLALYDKPSIYYFLNIVRPYLSKGMTRKDFSCHILPINQFPNRKKVTVNLPTWLNLKQPTKRIKEAISLLSDLNNGLLEPSNYKEFYANFVVPLKELDVEKISFQVYLLQGELWEIHKFQQQTGLLKSDAIYYCFLEMKKRPSIR